MNYLDAFILGLVQGLTEFIPVSSSGHLVITNYLLGVNDGFIFSVLLNFGTLSALLVFYRQKIVQILKKSIIGKEWFLLAKLAVSTVPAVIIGFLFASQIEKLNVMPWVVIIMLVSVGIIMIKYGSARPDASDEPIEESVNYRTAIKVGMAQAIALIPGTSRSGITILTGLQSKLSASKAAEYSFLLAIPTILGASLKVFFFDGGVDFVKTNFGVFLVGNITSFISGLLAVAFLIKLLSTRGLKDFGWYRIGLAAVLAVLLITGVI
jgi:undecaprenyl-diphosphatase